MPREYEATEMVPATLEAQEWNVVLAGLHELPGRICIPVINKLKMQLNPPDDVVRKMQMRQTVPLPQDVADRRVPRVAPDC